jgi:hypothetical protein
VVHVPGFAAYTGVYWWSVQEAIPQQIRSPYGRTPAAPSVRLRLLGGGLSYSLDATAARNVLIPFDGIDSRCRVP